MKSKFTWRQYVCFLINLIEFELYPRTNFAPLFQGHVGIVEFGRRYIRLQHIKVDKDTLIVQRTLTCLKKIR